MSRRPTALTWLAFAAVCVFWGTTANAIRVGVRAIPPVSLSGARFVTAGSLLLAVLVLAGRRLPKGRTDWGFLLAGGIGLALANATLNAAFTQVESGSGSSGTNAFAANLGGGLDLRLNHRFSIRLIEADYLLTTFNNQSNNRQNNARISAGAVIRFGK